MYGWKNVRNRRHDALAQIDHKQFEVVMAEHYAAQGWVVEHVGTGSGGKRFDGGIDLKLRREGEYVLVQCKHWNAKQVTHNAVHELLGIKINEGATGAVVVTSGEFTTAAKAAAARQGHVELIDGDAVRAMLGSRVLEVAGPAPVNAPGFASAHRAGSSMNPRNAKPSIAPLVKIVVAGFAALMLVQCFPKYVQSVTAPKPAQSPVPQPSGVNPAKSVASPQQPAAAPAYVPAEAATLSRQQEEEALRDWQRKNAESMRILEGTTPEL